MKTYLDKNGVELKSGDVINLHQTVNGENLFIILDAILLDIRYGFDITYKYQYDVVDLLSPNGINFSVEWEIVGNINNYVNTLR